MSAIPYESQTQDWKPPEDEAVEPPGRRRRQFFNRKSAALAAVIACVAGFFAGVRIEKTQLSSTASAATPSAAATASAGAPGARAGFAGAFRGGGGSNASIGTVSSVNGNTIYLTDSSGNTVKVKLSSATKITKSQGVSKGSVRPGDAVVIQGVKGGNGTISAASLSDSGASPSRTGAGTNGSTSTATSTGTTG